MKAPSTRPAAVLGLDVGKSSHWACLIDRDGEVLASAPVRNREAELDALFASAPAGTLVVVDQFRNIGSLAVRRARAAGLGVAHLPGLAASRAAGLFAGEAKTDERDAAVIARTALGVPDSLSGVPGRGEALEAARALSSQRDHVVACATRDGLATLMWTVPGGAQETGGPYMRDPRHPRHFTDEFKRQIVDLYNAGKPKREIMDEYDLGKSTVERWIKSINATGSPRAACNRTPEQNRILELERENRRLRMEVDVLKQAALIYARK
ncbi:Transposase [Collinsella aerofaciens]|nr:transposase [Collinsella aerofaciens]SUY69691.1 Transposase [Collinsella aerofaciens]